MTCGGSASRTVTSSKATFVYFIGTSEADHRDVAHGGDDLVRPVGDRGLADDERHGAALAGLLVEVHDLRPAEVRLARGELPEDLELLLAVEHTRDVDAEIAEQRARVRALVAEGHGEGPRRYPIAQRGRRSDSIVQIERIQIPDGSREFFDLSPFDRHREGRVLLADDGPVDLDRHQARPSVSSSVALARALMPTGVAARCFISTSVPTVPAPGERSMTPTKYLGTSGNRKPWHHTRRM